MVLNSNFSLKVEVIIPVPSSYLIGTVGQQIVAHNLVFQVEIEMV